MVTVVCPNCAASCRINDHKRGSQARCKCGQILTLSMALSETIEHAAKPVAGDEPHDESDSSLIAKESSPEPFEASEWGSTSDDAVPQPETTAAPEKLGQYLLKKKLGAGAMGEVFLAHDPKLQRHVAIKILPPRLWGDKERLERFLREARLAAQLHHTNVTAIYEINSRDQLVYIVMEFVDGRSLEETVVEDGPLPWREATRLIRDAAAGLAAAHKLGLIHRDIKPANLMCGQNGDTKVVDFGLARSLESKTRYTQEGMLLGTPDYMSPEQWTDADLDGRSDLYSLICTYYRLLTGTPPYRAPSIPAMGYQHRYEPFPDPRKLTPDLPDGVCRIIERGSRKDPASRHSDCEELVTELNALLASSPESLTFQVDWDELRYPHDNQPAIRPAVPAVALEAGRKSRPSNVTKILKAFSKWVRGPVGVGVLAAGLFVAIILSILLPKNTDHGKVKIELPDTSADVEVKIDGDTIGVEGLTEPLEIEVGLHGLEVTADGFDRFTKAFTVKRGDEMTVRVHLKPRERVSSSAARIVPGKNTAPATPGDSVRVSCRATLVGHSHRVVRLAISPDGKTLASSGDLMHPTIKTWDLDAGKLLGEFSGHTQLARSLAFSPDGKTLVASSGRDDRIWFWEVATGKTASLFTDQPPIGYSAAFTTDGKAVVFVDAVGAIRLRDLAPGGEQAILEDTARSLVYSPDGETLAATGEDAIIRLWDIKTGQVRATLRGQGEQPGRVAFAPSGEFLGSGSSDGIVTVWDTSTGKELATFSGHKENEPGSTLIMTRSNDGISKPAPPVNNSQVNVVAFAVNGRTAASGSHSGAIRIWDIHSGRQWQVLEEPRTWITDLAFSPDGNTLVCSTGGTTIKLFDVQYPAKPVDFPRPTTRQ